MKTLSHVGFLLLFILLSCHTSKITSSWQAKNIQPKKYDKILVLGLVRDADRSIREKMEQHVVGDLSEHGYNAICACEEFGPKSFENLTEEEALHKIKGSGIDGVLTVVLLDKTREKYYVPGYINYTPYYMYHNHFWGYYSTMQYRIYSPDYYGVTTKYFWESNFYEMSNKELVYSVQTQSFDPSSAENLANEYGKLIVADIIKYNVLSAHEDQNNDGKPF